MVYGRLAERAGAEPETQVGSRIPPPHSLKGAVMVDHVAAGEEDTGSAVEGVHVAHGAQVGGGGEGGGNAGRGTGIGIGIGT